MDRVAEALYLLFRRFDGRVDVTAERRRRELEHHKNIMSNAMAEGARSLISTLCLLCSNLLPDPTGQGDKPGPSDRDSATLHRTTPQLNYIGATIFISYIVAALASTALCLRIIQQQLLALPVSAPSTRLMQAAIFAVLALFSFATLSYNMLLFLVESFITWMRAADTVHLQTDSLLVNIWRWTTTSSLFLDFAKSLFVSFRTRYWTREALIATLLTYAFINSSRRLHRDLKTLPFMLLAQILPISFSLNLFYIYLLLSPDAPQRIRHNIETRILKTDNRRLRPRRWTEVGGIIKIWFVTACYTVTLRKLRLASDDIAFIGLVILTRVILMYAYAMPLPGSYVVQDALLMGTPLLIFAVGLKTYLADPQPLGIRLNKAAQTLQWDFIIWSISVLIWTIGLGIAALFDMDREGKAIKTLQEKKGVDDEYELIMILDDQSEYVRIPETDTYYSRAETGNTDGSYADEKRADEKTVYAPSRVVYRCEGDFLDRKMVPVDEQRTESSVQREH